MPSAKQIAWRKKFAKMAKSGVFRKTTKKEKKRLDEKHEYLGNIRRVREADEKYAKSLKSTESEYTGKWSRRYWKNKTRNVYAYIDFKNGKYYVITFRKNASPQWFKHKAMTLSEAQSYADGFNFQNK